MNKYVNSTDNTFQKKKSISIFVNNCKQTAGDKRIDETLHVAIEKIHKFNDNICIKQP